jgi:5'-3' exonuclease
MNRLLLIDSDFILYKCCYNQVITETEQMYGIKSDKTLQETLDLIDWYLVEKIFKPTNANYYIGFLGGEGNYRYSIDSGYKVGRSSERPPYFKEAKQHLIDKWKFTIVNGIETEDAVGITLNNFNTPPYLAEDINELIIIRQDHDLDQLPGTHFNPVTGNWKIISESKALYNEYHQILTGCSTDKVSGIPKVGPKRASKILEPYFMGLDLLNITFDAYLNYYKDSELAGKMFKINRDLIHILREKEDFIIPEIQCWNQEIKKEEIINTEF